jgi:hypothetical protein
MAKKKNTFNWGDGKAPKKPSWVNSNRTVQPIVDTEKRQFNNPNLRTVTTVKKPTLDKTYYKTGDQGLHFFNWGTQKHQTGGSLAGGINDYLMSAGLISNDPTNPGGGGGSGGYDWSGGGGGGGESAPIPVTWEAFDANIAGAPSWWKALKPSETNEATEYLAATNMLIPFLSPEDQRQVASNLYQQDPTNFAHLNPETMDKVNDQTIPFVPPSALTTGLRQQFTSGERASNALQALSQLAGATGKTDAELGPGYRYLRSILNVGSQFGGTGSNMQTRRQQLNAMGALDPLMSQSQQQSLNAYGPLARMLSQPYFSAGQLVPMQRTQDGRYVFGEANKELL